MKIAHVCTWLTSRVSKQFTAQLSAGDLVRCGYFASGPMVSVAGAERLTAEWELRALEEWADVIHWHTSLGDAGSMALVEPLRRPVVWDMNDYPGAEAIRAAGPGVSGYIVTGQAYARTVSALTDKPVLTVYNQCPLAWLPAVPGESLPGSVALASEVGNEAWRDYREVAGMLPHLWVYSTRTPSGMSGVYDVLERVPMPELLTRLGRYAWGWAGAANSRHRIDDCVTNKFWEYLAAGLPVLAWRSDEMRDLAVAGGFGVEFEERLPPEPVRRNCRERALAARWDFVMDNQLPALRGLYERVAR